MDRAAYLRRIGYDGPLTASADTLRALHEAHVFTVPFENLDIHLGRPISLDLPVLYDKIVRGCRGGYCFELNGLFAWLVESIGFTIDHLMARVRWGQTAPGPRSHRVLLVSLGGQRWIADVGFGGNGLIASLPLIPNRVDAQYAERFRVMREPDGEYRLDCEVRHVWEPLYSFTLASHLPVDYTYANYYHSHAPASLFTQTRLCTKPTPEGRLILRDRAFHTRAQGQTQVRTLDDAEAYRQVPEAQFGVSLLLAEIHRWYTPAAPGGSE